MKKDDKVKIIKWYIGNNCGLGKIQIEKDNTNDLKTLEKLVMDDRTYPHHFYCSTCWYEEKDYVEKCSVCNGGNNYTFPYGYWKKFYEKDNKKQI